MLATLAAAILAALSPLIGHGVENRIDTETPKRLAGPTVLNPRTLERAEDAPRFPRSATNVEISPDGDRAAALHGDDLVVASLRSGKTLGRVDLGGIDQRPTLSWIAGDRLLVLDCVISEAGRPCTSTRVRTVDPVRRDRVGEPLAFQGDFRTARVGARQLVVLDDWFVSYDLRHDPMQVQPPDRMAPAGVVLGADGRVEHVLDLSQWSAVDVDRSLLAGVDRETGRHAIGRVDLRRGRIAGRRLLPETGCCPFVLLPGLRDLAVVNAQPFDRGTLEPEGTSLVGGDGFETHAAGNGYVRSLRSKRDGYRVLRHYDAPGDRDWSRSVREDHIAEVVGRYLYVQQVRDHSRPESRPWTARFHVDIYRLRDGRHVRRVPGRFTLSAPEGGRSGAQIPMLWSDRGALNRADDEEY